LLKKYKNEDCLNCWILNGGQMDDFA